MNHEPGLLSPVRTGLRIDALVREQQTLYRSAVDQVFLHNLRCIFRLHMPVPDRLGINHDGGSVLALVEAAGLVNPNGTSQTGGFRKLLQLCMQFTLSIGGARWPRSALRTHIMANENVVLEWWQTSLLYSKITGSIRCGVGTQTFHISPFLTGLHLRE